MFQSLTENLNKILNKIRNSGILTEEHINATMREIRIALLEADVSLVVIKDLIQQISEKAKGQKIVRSVSPGQMMIKIIHDELVEFLAHSPSDISDQSKSKDLLKVTGISPINYMMIGLQGSGKTTSTAKIAARLSSQGKKVMVVSLDIYRPAAQLQLSIAVKDTNITSLPIIENENVLQIVNRAIKESKQNNYDIVIYDTAGRLHIDEPMLKELDQVKLLTAPEETLLVIDAMTGQEAVNIVQQFNDRLDISGIILTRIDGDARGGAALSVKYVTGKPIKFIGNGEKISALEEFHPERIVSRILGKGDIVTLVEHAASVIDKEEAEKTAKKLEKGRFDLNDYLQQLRTIKKMGGIGSMLKFLPGMGLGNLPINNNMLNDNLTAKQEAIILSMTKKERSDPKILNGSRRRRIATGSGTSVQEVNILLKQFYNISELVKKTKKMQASGKLNNFNLRNLLSKK